MYRRNPTDVRLINSLKVFDKLPPDEREGLRLALIEIVFNSIGIDHYDRNATSDELLEEYGADARLTGKSVIDGAVPWLAQQLSKERFQSQREADALLDTLRRRFRALCTWATETRQNLSGMSIRQALEESQGYQSFAQRKGKLESDVNPTLYRFADGWKVVELRTEKALEREGDLMDHCVGGDFEKVKSGESRIFSLRDPANKPHVTMEYKPAEESFKQIFGPSNKKPEEYTRPYLREFLEKMLAWNLAALLRAFQLAGVPAKELDLQGAKLQRAKLQRANLQGAKLQRADLQGAKLQGAFLYKAELQGADLQGAKLKTANLRSARLQGAELQGADLRYAILRGAKLQGAKLQGAIYNDETSWPTGFDPEAAGARLIAPKSDLQGADLQGADLQGADLQGAKLQRADLYRADLQGAKFRSADLQGAKLQRAKLQRADLQGAKLQGADLRGARKLGYANLQDAKLQRAKLQGADLELARLQDADLQGAQLYEANLRGADLRGAKNLEYAEIRGAFYNDNTKWPDDFDPEAAGAIYESIKDKFLLLEEGDWLLEL